MHRLLPGSSSTDEAGGASHRAGLCRPRPSIAFITPSDAHPTRSDFPFDGYTHRLLLGRRPRAGEGLSSSRHHLPHVPRHYAGGFIGAALPGSSRLPWPSPCYSGLGSPLSPHGVGLTTRQTSLHAADRTVAPSNEALDAGLRRRAFPPDAASLLPGSLMTTRTGLPPAGGDELVGSNGQVINTHLRSDRARPLDTQYAPQPRKTELRCPTTSSSSRLVSRRAVRSLTLALMQAIARGDGHFCKYQRPRHFFDSRTRWSRPKKTKPEVVPLVVEFEVAVPRLTPAFW